LVIAASLNLSGSTKPIVAGGLAGACHPYPIHAVQTHYLAARANRRPATPEPIKDWSLTSLKEKLSKIGAKVVSHGRYVVFQMAEVAIPRQMFQEILRLIAELRPQPPPAPA
jgi:hypothetical protein